LGRISPTPLCARGLVGRENAKPGVILLTNSQRGVSPAGEGADTVPKLYVLPFAEPSAPAMTAIG